MVKIVESSDNETADDDPGDELTPDSVKGKAVPQKKPTKGYDRKSAALVMESSPTKEPR